MGKRREGERVVSVATDGIVSVFLSSELEFFSVSWLTVFYYYCRTRDDFAIQFVGTCWRWRSSFECQIVLYGSAPNNIFQ